MNKRGQFYLIAALVIVGLLVGITALFNFTTDSRESTRVFDISSELEHETNQILNNGFFNVLTKDQLDSNIEVVTDSYAERNPDTDFYIIHGDDDEMHFVFYSNTGIGSIEARYGSVLIDLTQIELGKSRSPPIQNDDSPLEIIINGETTYDYDLRPGGFVFVVLKKERNGETFISAPVG